MLKKSTNKKLPSYEDRLILFVDFLGFSEIVGKTATDLVAVSSRTPSAAPRNQ
jgi:hypothetical protein